MEYGEPAREVSCIGVIVDGKILLGQRNDNGRWTNPGGHREGQETPIEAAVRELYEETGVEADFHDLKHLESQTVADEQGEPVRVHAYNYLPQQKPEVVLDGDPDGEIGRWKWIPLNSIPENSKLHVPRGRNVLLNALGLGE